MKKPRRMRRIEAVVWGLTFAMLVCASGQAAGWIHPVTAPGIASTNHSSLHGSAADPSLSANGKWLAFVSDAPDLVLAPSPRRVQQVYVQDLLSGTIQRISVAPDGVTPGNDTSDSPSISMDGRYVAFRSFAANLTTNGAAGQSQIYVRDLLYRETRQASQSPDGQPANGPCLNPVVDEPGTSVTFISVATNLIPAPGLGRYLGLFRRRLADDGMERLDTGTEAPAGLGPVDFDQSADGTVNVMGMAFAFADFPPTTNGVPTDFAVRDEGSLGPRLVWVPAIDAPGNVSGYLNAVSRDGAAVAFLGYLGDGRTGYWWHDLKSDRSVNVVSPERNSNEMVGREPVPSLSADGRLMAFERYTSDRPGVVQLWREDRGLLQMRDLAAGGGEADPVSSSGPVLSPDGRYLAYWSADAYPQGGLTETGTQRLFLRELLKGTTRLLAPGNTFESDQDAIRFATNSLALVITGDSVHGGQQRTDLYLGDAQSEGFRRLTQPERASAVADLGGSLGEAAGGVSDDGNRILFRSNSPDFVAGDENRRMDVFVRDQKAGWVRAIGTVAGGGTIDGGVTRSALSADGSAAVFVSRSGRFLGGVSNKADQIFVQQLDLDRVVLASAKDGTLAPGIGKSWDPKINRNGSRILFVSTSVELAGEADVSTRTNLYLRDLTSQRTYRVNRYDPHSDLFPGSVIAGSASMSGDGGNVVFLAAPNGNPEIAIAYRWTLATQSLEAFSNQSVIRRTVSVGIDDAGTRVFRVQDWNEFNLEWLLVRELNSGDEATAAWSPDQARPFRQVRFSADGRTLVFASDYDLPVPNQGQSLLPNPPGVFAWDVASNQLEAVSVDSRGTPSSGAADSFSVSRDGNRIAFRGRCGDLASGDDTGTSNIFIRDRRQGLTQLVSRATIGTRAGNWGSYHPLLSADGGTVVFMSFADDLIDADFNDQPDVFEVSLPRWLDLVVKTVPGSGDLELRWSVPDGTAVALVQVPSLRGNDPWKRVTDPGIDGGSGTLTSEEVAFGRAYTRRLLSPSGSMFFRLQVVGP